MDKIKRSKNYIKAKKLVPSEPVSIEKAVQQVKKANLAKFNATIELKININVDPKDSEQNVDLCVKSHTH